MIFSKRLLIPKQVFIGTSYLPSKGPKSSDEDRNENQGFEKALILTNRWQQHLVSRSIFVCYGHKWIKLVRKSSLRTGLPRKKVRMLKYFTNFQRPLINTGTVYLPTLIIPFPQGHLMAQISRIKTLIKQAYGFRDGESLLKFRIP